MRDIVKYFFLYVSTFVRIEQTSDIKIYDHLGAAISIRLLKDIILQYEMEETFSFGVELINNDGQEFDMQMHALVLMKQLKHLIATSKNEKVLNKNERSYKRNS